MSMIIIYSVPYRSVASRSPEPLSVRNSRISGVRKNQKTPMPKTVIRAVVRTLYRNTLRILS